MAIVYVLSNYGKIRAMDEGTERMQWMAKTIRDGARTFIWTEYKVIVPVVVIVAFIFSAFIEKSSGFTFIIGAAMSSLVCILSMRCATYANVRTANRARESLSIAETVKVALLGGSVAGLAVQSFALMGLVVVFFAYGGIKFDNTGSGFFANLGTNPSIMRLTTYSLGCSLVAMFNRVAGGNYTKAADISSDIVAKIRHKMPEDDARVPNVIADFIGDNVNDVAGNGSDLLESFVAAIIAAIIIAATMYLREPTAPPQDTLNVTTFFPIAVAGGGLLSCLCGLFYAQKKKMGENPSRELNIATYISAGMTITIALVIARVAFGDEYLYSEFIYGWLSPWMATTLGVLAGVLVGAITEYYTSTDFTPTRRLAEIAPEGEAFVTTLGDAIGSKSVLLPVIVIGLAIYLSGKLAGSYGIAMAALGMLSFVGTTVSIDAFGPISDNAGGIAESCHLPEDVRKITDKLDAVGNTTAAIGKGFAIGSAALATVSLITAYVGSYTPVQAEITLNFAHYTVVAGGIIGGALIEFFSAMLTENTIEAAKQMADVGDGEMTDAVVKGEKEPNYQLCIKLAATNALRKMLAPSLLAMFIPVIGGICFGVEFVGGILVGATIVAIGRAIFMGNSGGAFDNAKKYIETGSLNKYVEKSIKADAEKYGWTGDLDTKVAAALETAHDAAVTGDTIGDTRKDVVGVALDIFIKMMSTVANTLAPVFARITLFR